MDKRPTTGNGPLARVMTDPRLQRVSGLSDLKPGSPASQPGTPNSVKLTMSPSSPNLRQQAPPSASKLPSRGSANNLTAMGEQRSQITETPVSLSTGKVERVSSKSVLSNDVSAASPAAVAAVADKRETAKRKHEPDSNGDVKRLKTTLPKDGKSSASIADSVSNSSGKRNVMFSLPDSEAGHGYGMPNGHEPSIRANHSSSNYKASVLPPDSLLTSASTSLHHLQTVQQDLSLSRTSTEFFASDRPASPPSSVKSRDSSLRTPTVSRLPRVKSTKELMQDLCESGELSVAANSETVARISRNLIDREPDEYDAPVVPMSALPRRRRQALMGMCPPSTSDRLLHQTKSELMQKFLASATGDGDASSPALLLKLNLNNNKVVADDDLPTASRIKTEEELWMEQALKDPWALLPAGLLEQEEEEVEEGVEPVAMDDGEEALTASPLPITDEFLDRLHSDHVPGMNGSADSAGVWHSWREAYSTLPTHVTSLAAAVVAGGPSSSILQQQLLVLPYVDVDF